MILAIVMVYVLSFCNAYHSLDHTTGKELLHILEGGYYQDGGLHRVYVIMFYNPGVGSQNLQAKNDEYRTAIKAQVLDKFDDVYYTEVDATNSEYVRFAEEVVGINTAELIHAPSLLIMEYGHGVWIHGPEAVGRISKYVPMFQERAKSSGI